MRKMIIMLMVVGFSLFSATNAILDESKVTGYSIKADTDSYLDIDFNIKDINVSEINTEKGVFSSVTIDNGYVTRNVGSPALPTFRHLIEMPYGAVPEVEVISYETQSYKLEELGISAPIIPAQPSYTKNTRPEDIKFVIDENAYNASKFNEGPIATTSKSGTLRGVGIGSVLVEPFRYNPSTGEILVYNNVKVRVNYVGADPRAAEIAREEYSPYFDFPEGIFINHKDVSAKADLTNYPITYLIVANINLNGNAKLNEFIAWKEAKGFNVIENYVDSATTIETIDSWVETQYNTLSPKPSFLLIIGDDTGSYIVDTESNPPIGNSPGRVTRSDLLYGVIGTVSTSNYIPSIYVGRFSLQSLADLDAQIDKTIWYEKDQFAVATPALNYLSRAMIVAGADATYQATHGNPHVRYGMAWYLNDTYVNPSTGTTNGITGLSYLDGATGQASNIIDNVNTGVAFYNYTAHGGNDQFVNPNFGISDINGLNNDGKYGLVIGNCCLTGSFGDTECFGEAWLNAPDKGSIGFIGASMNTVWNEDLCMGIGSAGAGQVAYGDTTPPFTPNSPGMLDGLMLMNNPTQAGLKHVGLLAVETYGSSYKEDYWSAYQLFGDPSIMLYMGIPGTITASHDGVIAPGVTTYTVTTTPYAYVAMGDQAGVLHGAAQANSSGVANVSVTPYSVDDTGKLVITAQFKEPYFEDVLCTEDIGGSYSQSTSSLGFGLVDVGASNTLQFTISNAHNSEFILGEITTITGYTVSLATKGDVKDVKNVLIYSVGPNDSTIFDLKFEPASGGNFNGNITITSSDTGHATEYIAVTGSCEVPDIDLPESIAASAKPGNSVIENFNIDNLDIGSLDYNIAINYTSGKDIKASGGPDTYGYKWKDSDEADGPVYNWVEINNLGTGLGLGDEGGSAALNLGFTFNYYGINYTTIVVGSNGAATFTGPAPSYTNATIPTATAPNALLCPFWDDLNPIDGGEIYYYADGANNRFIIEWDGVPRYGWGGTNPYTFQIIIYGTGKILFQYKDMQGTLTSCTVGIEDYTGTDGNLVVYNAAYLKDNLAIQFMATPEWLSLDKTSGTVAGMGSDVIAATCDAAELQLGVYTADIIITSNDPDEATKILPVTFTVSDSVGIEDNIMVSTELYQNYPNPFNPSTNICFSLANDALVELAVYNMTGQTVATLAKDKFSRGSHNVEFNASNLTSGMYYYILNVDSKFITRKMILIK